MNETELAANIAHQVLKNTQFWIAIVGLVGAIIGSTITICGNLLLHWFKTRKESTLDNARKELLKILLQNMRKNIVLPQS